MSLFGKRVEERAVTSVDWIQGNDATPSVTEARALRLSPVFAAIRHIVDYCATLPVDFHRQDGKSRTPMSSAPVLFRNLMEAGELEPWLGRLFYSLITRGSSVGLILARDGQRVPTVIEWLPMDKVSVDDRNFRFPIWKIGGQQVDASELVHIPWITAPGRTLGLSPIEAYAAAVNAGLSAQEYSDVKRGGGIPPAHLKNSRLILDPETSAAIQSKAVKSFASGKPFVSGNDWDLTMISIPPNHAQFIETMNLSANQIASIYGVDPTEVGGEPPGSLTYSTDETRQIKRAHNMQPYLIRVERGLSARLSLPQFMRFNVDSKIRADLKARWDVNKIRVDMGVASLNEIRALEDEPPIPGGDFSTPEALPRAAALALDLAKGAPSLLQNPGLVELTRQIQQTLNGEIPAEPPAPEGDNE